MTGVGVSVSWPVEWHQLVLQVVPGLVPPGVPPLRVFRVGLVMAASETPGRPSTWFARPLTFVFESTVAEWQARQPMFTPMRLDLFTWLTCAAVPPFAAPIVDASPWQEPHVVCPVVVHAMDGPLL